MGTNEYSQPASKSSWDSQDFGDVNMVLKWPIFTSPPGHNEFTTHCHTKIYSKWSKIFQQCLIQQTYSEMCQTVPACQMTHFRNMWNQTNLLSRSSPGSSFPHGVSISWISHPGIYTSWWRHQIGTFSESLAFVRGIHRWPANSAHKGQWHEALLFFYLRLNQQLSKQWRRRWFETPSCSVWRHCNEYANFTYKN